MIIPVSYCIRDAKRSWPAWQCCAIGISLSLFAGLRHEVGGDWFNYLPYVSRAIDVPFQDIFIWGDPGYNILNWIFAHYSWGIYGVNLISSLIFTAGLVAFCRAQPCPWLALSISIPYLVIVVAMGYSRQGVAIGLIMPGLLALERGNLRLFILSIAAAATFHSTSLVMMAFILPSISGRTLLLRFLRILILILVGSVLVYTFLSARLDGYISGYIDSEYQSEGAAIRVAMNLIPALFILRWPRRFSFNHQSYLLWRSIALTAVVCFIAFILLPSNSTAVDRISLYVIPLQLVVLARIPGARLFGLSSQSLLALVLLYSVSVQFVWLNFATHAYGWLPYSNILFR